MPKESNHRKSKDKECKQEFIDYDDFEKQKADRKTKNALKETLKVLNDYVETHKKDSPCQVKNKCNDKSRHQEKEECDEKELEEKKECCCECECAKCVVASFKSCDAPEIDELVNTVYTPIPRFFFPENGTTISLGPFITPDTAFQLGTFNFYVTLPCDEDCGEVRLLWPLVWMIPEIVQRLNGRFTLPVGATEGFVRIIFNLNVLSKRLIKAPAQLITTLNTGGVTNGPFICDASSAAIYDYNFLFRFVPSTIIPPPGMEVPAVLGTGSTVIFSTPNHPVAGAFLIDPVTFALALRIPIDPAFEAFFETLDELFGLAGSLITLDTIPDFIGAIPVSSPAHHVSFVPSCDRNDGCDIFWVATNLSTLRV